MKTFGFNQIRNIFLVLVVLLGIYLRLVMVNSSIQDYQLRNMILPNMGLSSIDVLTSKYHSELFLYKTIVCNLFFDWFGVNEVTYRILAFTLSLLTFLLIYLFANKEVSKQEAVVAVFLFAISYYSLWSVNMPDYASFYMAMSFLTFLFLWKAIEEKNKWIYWFLFALFNFLNLTNLLLAFVYIPTLIFCALFLVLYVEDKNAFPIVIRKKIFVRFICVFAASISFSLWLYAIKGINIFSATIDLLMEGEFKNAEIAPVSGQEHFNTENTRWELFLKCLKVIFVTGNFKGEGKFFGYEFLPWVYLFFFILGVKKIFLSNHRLFWCYVAFFIPPPIFSAFILNIIHSRAFSFVIPLYLIGVSVGLTNLAEFLEKIIKSQIIKSLVYYVGIFIAFAWLLQPKPIWSLDYLDEVYGTRRMAFVRQHLKENIQPDDIILNATRVTELRSKVGDALTMFNYGFYLEEFFKEHRLELLPGKKGKVGVWLILQKPLKINNGLAPFYFLPKFNFKLVAKANRIFLYYSSFKLISPKDFENDKTFVSPFWTFIKARYFQERGDFRLAEVYYKKMIEGGISIERAYYNLGLMHTRLNYLVAREFFGKAVQILESPSVVPPNVEIETFSPNSIDQRGMVGYLPQNKKLRSYWIYKNGIRHRYWVKDQHIALNSPIYSNFYITPGILNYLIFQKTGHKPFWDDAIKFLKKGLKMFPSHPKASLIKKILVHKNKNIPIKDFGPFYVADLMGIYEEFPTQKIERN